MYGIFTYIWLIFMVNVAKYTIHGYYGNRWNKPTIPTDRYDHFHGFTLVDPKSMMVLLEGNSFEVVASFWRCVCVCVFFCQKFRGKKSIWDKLPWKPQPFPLAFQKTSGLTWICLVGDCWVAFWKNTTPIPKLWFLHKELRWPPPPPIHPSIHPSIRPSIPAWASSWTIFDIRKWVVDKVGSYRSVLKKRLDSLVLCVVGSLRLVGRLPRWSSM